MGVRRYGEELRIEPHLPDEWRSASANIIWRGERLEITVTKEKLTVKNLTGGKAVSVLHKGRRHEVDGVLEIAL